jgi:hypothetical protein
MAENGEKKSLSKRIADALGETQAQPRRQIKQIVALCGEDFAEDLLAETQRIEADGGMMTGDGSRRRSPGGVFFHLARQQMTSEQKKQVFWTKRKKKKKQPPANSNPASGEQSPAAMSPDSAPVPEKTPQPPAKSRKPAPPPPLPALRWRDRDPLLPGLIDAAGTVTQATLTLRGRPGRVTLAGDLVLLAFKHEVLLTRLPDGVPTPDGVTRYYLLASAALWPPVVQALEADPRDELIAAGPCLYDAEHEAVILLAHSLTTHALQHGRKFDDAPPDLPVGEGAFSWADRPAVFRVLWGDPGEATSAVLDLVGQPGALNANYRKLRVGALRQTGATVPPGLPDPGSGATVFVAYMGHILWRRVMDRVKQGAHDLALTGYLLHDRKTDTLGVFVTGTEAVPRSAAQDGGPDRAAATPAEQLAALVAEETAIKAELGALLDDPDADAGAMAQLIKRRREIEKALKKLRKAHPGLG